VHIDMPTFPKCQGHVPGAWFVIRAQLDEALSRLPKDKSLVFPSPDGALACLAAADALSLGWGKPVSAFAGGTTTWTNAGLPLEAGLLKAASEPTDVYRRPYEGTDNSAAAMQAYLDWECGLVELLERDGSHAFYVI
jgi:rhodanese-related sulfurtransferase